MNEERVWHLLSVQLSGEATAEELQELETLLQQQPELALRINIMRNVWNSEKQSLPHSANPFDKHLQRLSNHLAQPALQFESTTVITPIQRSPVKRVWIAVAAVAASAIIVFGIFTYTNKKPPAPLSALNTISTRPGSKSKVELPDGTQVWLNADSKLTYDQNFSGNTREVNLTGEAFFDVAHATSLKTGERVPFIIHTTTVDVKVLGTAFNVRSYPNEKTTETALVRGSVEVTLHASPDKKIILKPDEKLVVKNEEATIVSTRKTEVDEPVMTLSKMRPYKRDSTGHYETLWVTNKLAFENELLQQMLPEIERWYNVTVIVKNEKLMTLHFTGVFENKSLAEVMEALSISSKFHYDIKGSQVTIW